jgi:NAD(P)H-flavin reductase/hemoglobin-like flavoprotein
MIPLPDVAMTYFYGHIFAAEPEIRAMFPPAMSEQHRRFYQALTASAGADADQSGRDEYLAALGRAHRKYGVRKEHYQTFRTALLATCHEFALAPDDEATMLAVFDRAAQAMNTAADAEAGQSPAWWTAEVSGHELLGPDIAVLALRTDEPLRYQAGQHVSVQTPRWPRLWRHYSVGCAPRPDGMLVLHVRAVPGGLVSTALVHRTRPGDTLLLGPAEGTMTADVGSGRDVLCLAGGTGLAPLMAITEALIEAGEGGTGDDRRNIVLYHGARTARELYGLPPLRRMAARYPRLKVIAATSDEEAPESVHGSIPELGTKAEWQDRDIYVSGPDAMITATERALLDAGAPPELIHYDLPGHSPQ